MRIPLNSSTALAVILHTTDDEIYSQNGVAERFNRTIMDTVRSMLHHANLAETLTRSGRWRCRQRRM